MHIVLGLRVGGLEKFVLDLVAHYTPRFRPLIVCLEEKGELGRQYGNLQIIELGKQPGLSWKTVNQLIRLINQHNIQLIHTHNPSPHFYGAMAGFLTRSPVIHTKHGRNYPTEWKKVWLNRIASLLTDKVVAVSQDAADVCTVIEKIPPEKVAVILNGIDTSVFCPPEKNRVDDVHPVRIGIVARLSAEKDHQTLLQAMRLLVEQGEFFHLDIIGDGSLRAELEQTVKDFGLNPHVSFVGMRHDIPALLRDLDVFVLSSITEGISLTLLEAMATGLPVVATSVGGNPEVVVDGSTGYIVPPQEPGLMAEVLAKLIGDRLLRHSMGICGRRRVVERFSITETARAYELLYRSVLEGG